MFWPVSPSVRQIIISPGMWSVKSALPPSRCSQSEWIPVVQPTRNVSSTAPTNKTLTSSPRTRVSEMTTHTHPLPFSLFRWYSITPPRRAGENVGQSLWAMSWLLSTDGSWRSAVVKASPETHIRQGRALLLLLPNSTTTLNPLQRAAFVEIWGRQHLRTIAGTVVIGENVLFSFFFLLHFFFFFF